MHRVDCLLVLAAAGLLLTPLASAGSPEQDAPRSSEALVGAGESCVVGYTTVCYPKAGDVAFVETDHLIWVAAGVAYPNIGSGMRWAECTYDKTMPAWDDDAYSGGSTDKPCQGMEFSSAWIGGGESGLCQIHVRIETWKGFFEMDAVGTCS